MTAATKTAGTGTPARDAKITLRVTPGEKDQLKISAGVKPLSAYILERVRAPIVTQPSPTSPDMSQVKVDFQFLFKFLQENVRSKVSESDRVKLHEILTRVKKS